MITSEKIRKFDETVNAANSLNGSRKSPTFIVVTHNGAVIVKDFLSLYDFTNLKYLIALGEYTWGSNPFTNYSANLLGFFDDELNLVDKLTINEKYRLCNIKFTQYRGSYYNAYNPRLVIRNNVNEDEEIKLENDLPWKDAFPKLFQIVKEKE